MTKIIFAVESGEYDEHGVDALFTDREAAQRYADWMNGPEDSPRGGAIVVEWPVDLPIPKTGRWSVAGTLEEWLRGGTTERDVGWWEPNSTARTNATRFEDGSVWIAAYGKDEASTIRSGLRMARAIQAGSYTVPEAPWSEAARIGRAVIVALEARTDSGVTDHG